MARVKSEVQIVKQELLAENLDIGLSQTINKIKEELLDAQRHSTVGGSPAMFRVESVTIEVKFTIKETQNTSGGVDIRLLAVKADDKIESERVHTVTINMVGLEKARMGLLQDREKAKR